MSKTSSHRFCAGSARVILRDVKIGSGPLIDELQVEADRIDIEASHGGGDLSLHNVDLRFAGVISEVNLNNMLSEAQKSDGQGTIRNLRVAINSGRVQIKGHFVKSVMSLPFALDAVPIITNGLRLSLQCTTTQVGGISLPAVLVELVERILLEHLSLDLEDSPLGVTLDSVLCSPGRLTITGRSRPSPPRENKSLTAHENVLER